MTLQWVDWLVLVPIAIMCAERTLLAFGSFLSGLDEWKRKKFDSAAVNYLDAEHHGFYIIGSALSIALYWKFLAG